MYTAEQWLADLEAKAAEASLAEKQGLVCGWWDIAEFREAATPETVLRLAEGCDCDADTCLPGCTPQCVLKKAYAATEV